MSSTAKSEKTMSSRLLTMKFMQRAAASAAAKEAYSSAAEDSQPSTPKRPRLSEQNSSTTPRTSELEAISAALAAEEEKRREAIARQAAEAGETEWVLDIPPATNHNAPQPLVVAADSLDADGDVGAGGRRAYGNFKRKPRTVSEGAEGQKIQNPTDPARVQEFIDNESAKARKKDKAKLLSQGVDLKNLTSISGGSSRQGAPETSQKKKKKRKSR
ncbi:hypothetical protein N7474_000072 [Penicillium riverlandense]|uniref:uncharacterized protein n=1 Tax=Penicillium riverlandense TaxID=1903569 RepID=UPI002546D3BE|nr:uncharacterized protein N7474_000072 [Penicillium riverlandense]KAJ5831761.1 hypothetical protein N7474_000072 [Penicillium riverlandense]